MNPYVIRFAIVNAVLTVVLGVIAEIIKLKSGGGFAVACAIAASFFAASAFAKDHSREPTVEEKRTFAWRALVATWLISLVLTAIVLAIFSTAAEVGDVLRFLMKGSVFALVAGTLLLVSAIYYVGIRWSFGWYARQVAVKAGTGRARRAGGWEA